MWRLTGVVLLALVASMAAFEIQAPTFSLLQPQGVKMAYPHEDGMSLVAYHYSINKPLPGVEAGDWNYDITGPTGNEWVHENREAVVNVGDIVYYWILVIHDGTTYQLTDQEWKASAEDTTPVPTEGTPAPTSDPGQCTSYPCLIFEDNFDTFNFVTWEHELTAGGGGNWEFQYYTNNRSNSYVKDGMLYLKPTLTADKYNEDFLYSGLLDIWGSSPATLCTGNQFWGCSRQGFNPGILNPIASARLRTTRSMNLRFGKIEIEAQVPKGEWIWPALWMVPTWVEYGDWPASGEIDIMESRGNADVKDQDGLDQGHNSMGQTMHWGPYWPLNGYEKTHVTKRGDFGDRLHKYGMEWDEDSMRFFLDGELTLTVDPGEGGFWEYGGFHENPAISNPWRHSTSKMAPFDKEFYIIMNVAVGGTNSFFPDHWTYSPNPKPWLNTSPQAALDFWLQKDKWYPTWNPFVNDGEDAAMKINYVRVWKLQDN